MVTEVRSGRLYNYAHHTDELKKIGFDWGGDGAPNFDGPPRGPIMRNIPENEDNFAKSGTLELSTKYFESVDKFCIDILDEEKSVLSKYHMASGLPQLLAQMLDRIPERRIELWEVKKKLNDLVLSVGEIAVMKRIEQLSDVFNKRLADVEGRIDLRLDAQEEAINELKEELSLQANLLDGLYDKSNLYPRLLLIVPDTTDINTHVRELGVQNITPGKSFTDSLSTSSANLNLMAPAFHRNFNWKRFLMQEYRVCCICEFTGVVLDSGLKVAVVKKWFKRAAPFIQV